MINIYKKLITLANCFDDKKLYSYADKVDKIIKYSSLQTSLISLVEKRFPNENKNKVYGIVNAFIKRNKKFVESNELEMIFSNILDQIQKLEDLTQINLGEIKKRNIVEEYKSIGFSQGQAEKLADININMEEAEWLYDAFTDRKNNHSFEHCVRFMEDYSKKRESVNLEELYTIDELLNTLESFEDSEVFYIKIEDSAIRNSIIIYEDEDLLVVHPRSTKASQYWAKGTTWCTGYKTEVNMFDEYCFRRKDNWIFYYILTKKDSKMYDPKNLMDKISLVYKKEKGILKCVDDSASNATVNKGNNSIKKKDVEEYLGDKSDKIFAAVESHATNMPDDEKFSEEGILEIEPFKFFNFEKYNYKEIVSEDLIKKKGDQLYEAIKDESRGKAIEDIDAVTFFSSYLYEKFPEQINEKKSEIHDYKFLYFFKNGAHKHPNLKDISIELLNNASRHDLRYIIYEFIHEDEFMQQEEIKNIWVPKALEYLDEKDKFKYNIMKYEESVEESAASIDPNNFFYYELHLRDEYKPYVLKMYENCSIEGEDFFKYKMHLSEDLSEYIYYNLKKVNNVMLFIDLELYKLPYAIEIIAEKIDPYSCIGIFNRVPDSDKNMFLRNESFSNILYSQIIMYLQKTLPERFETWYFNDSAVSYLLKLFKHLDQHSKELISSSIKNINFTYTEQLSKDDQIYLLEYLISNEASTENFKSKVYEQMSKKNSLQQDI